jgi:hypothetical protein
VWRVKPQLLLELSFYSTYEYVPVDSNEHQHKEGAGPSASIAASHSEYLGSNRRMSAISTSFLLFAWRNRLLTF